MKEIYKKWNGNKWWEAKGNKNERKRRKWNAKFNSFQLGIIRLQALEEVALPSFPRKEQ